MRKTHWAITTASMDTKTWFKYTEHSVNAPRSLATEILTHRKFVKLQYIKHLYLAPSSSRFAKNQQDYVCFRMQLTSKCAYRTVRFQKQFCTNVFIVIRFWSVVLLFAGRPRRIGLYANSMASSQGGVRWPRASWAPRSSWSSWGWCPDVLSNSKLAATAEWSGDQTISPREEGWTAACPESTAWRESHRSAWVAHIVRQATRNGKWRHPRRADRRQLGER